MEEISLMTPTPLFPLATHILSAGYAVILRTWNLMSLYFELLVLLLPACSTFPSHCPSSPTYLLAKSRSPPHLGHCPLACTLGFLSCQSTPIRIVPNPFLTPWHIQKWLMIGLCSLYCSGCLIFCSWIPLNNLQTHIYKPHTVLRDGTYNFYYEFI